MAEKFEFLTNEWFEAAKVIRDDLPAPSGSPTHKVRMNMLITDAPFDDGSEIKVHMDTSDGEMKMDLSHLDNPDLTITVDYDTAKAIFVEQNPAAGMQAFMAGKVKVQGDMTKLMAMQQGTPDPSAVEAAQRIKDITV